MKHDSDMKHDADMAHHGEDASNTGEQLTHSHNKIIDTSTWKNQPAITLTAHKDDKSGWNLHVMTSNFLFAPKHVNKIAIEGEGHAHLYINGRKDRRLYTPWHHLEYLGPGTHSITVTLNANDHSHLTIGNELIQATVHLIEK